MQNKELAVKNMARILFGGLLLFIGTDVILYFFGKSVILVVYDIVMVYVFAVYVAMSKKYTLKEKRYVWIMLFVYLFLGLIQYAKHHVLYATVILAANMIYSVHLLLTRRIYVSVAICAWTFFMSSISGIFITPYYSYVDPDMSNIILLLSVIPASLFTYAISKKISSDTKERGTILFFSLIYSIMSIGIIFQSMNYALDLHEPISDIYEISDKYIYHGSRGSMDWYITINYDGEEVDFLVSSTTYEKLDVGDEIVVSSGQGLFGIRYLTRYY